MFWRTIARVLSVFGDDINLNILAMNVAEKEGKKKSMTIAQIKEVQRIVIEEIAEYDLPTIARLMRRKEN